MVGSYRQLQHLFFVVTDRPRGPDRELFILESSVENKGLFAFRDFDCLGIVSTKGTHGRFFGAELLMSFWTERVVCSDWVSEKIFNKYLETIGFQKIRVRVLSVVR